ncbi:MAG: hypothetical protein KGL10_03380 [Alphaproteobacteria bacterium]|nr:hypothetical protein [Alphaproteobacteria bacterium]MDE2336332.1 hypothetical protein [Alphaproteobacteria bacterium]
MKKWNLKSTLAAATDAADRLAGKTYEKAEELAGKAREKAAPAAASALKTAFNGATGATGYLAEKTLGKYLERKDDADYPTLSGVPLTAGETALMKSIFGDEIDTDQVKKYLSDKPHPFVIAMASSGKKIKFYGKETHVPDYSQTKNASNYWTFVHEMTHVWQFQHPKEDILRALRNPTRRYDYELSEDSRFQDFGVEQQACIIADYALQCLFRGAKIPANGNNGYYLPVENTDPRAQTLKLLFKTVEDRFPQARETRLTLRPPSKKPSSKDLRLEGF